MAKDKGTKPEKAGKAKGGNDPFAKPSEAPNTGGDGFKFESEDNVGELFIITPLREDVVTTGQYGDADIIVADVVRVNKKRPEKSEEHENVYIFGAWVRGSLRGYIGERKVLGVLGQDAAKSKSKNPAWVLEDADASDLEAATAYLASVDPFAQKGAKNKSKGKGK